jgi:hypothetical protein
LEESLVAKSKPDSSREFTSGERRVALTRVYLKMTCPDLYQHGRTRLANSILALLDGESGRSQRRITDAQIVEMVWRNMQCINHRCPMLLFGKQLADELNEFFAEEEWKY